MQPELPSPAPPRRKRRFLRVCLLILVAASLYACWREYDFRRAIREVKAAEMEWFYNDPFEAIRKDWHAAFRWATWTQGERDLWIGADKDLAFVRERNLVSRLRPRHIVIADCGIESLKEFVGLKSLMVHRCRNLKTLGGLEDAAALEELHLIKCQGLENVDALKFLTHLHAITFDDCPGIRPDTLAALKAALPNTKISTH